MGETELAASMKSAVEQFGGRMLRLHSGQTKVRGGWMHHNKSGCPDWLVMLPRGVSFFAEIKFEKNDPNPDQLDWHAWARRAGYKVGTFRTVRELIAACQEATR